MLNTYHATKIQIAESFKTYTLGVYEMNLEDAFDAYRYTDMNDSDAKPAYETYTFFEDMFFDCAWNGWTNEEVSALDAYTWCDNVHGINAYPDVYRDMFVEAAIEGGLTEMIDAIASGVPAEYVFEHEEKIDLRECVRKGIPAKFAPKVFFDLSHGVELTVNR